MKNNRKNYKKLAEFLFSDSKKLVLLAGGVLLAALSFSLFFISVNSTIVASRRQTAVETHGRFLAVFTDIDKEIADEIMEKEPMFDYQVFQVQDEMYYGSSRFFSGWVTEETGKNMGIFLKEGAWPERENEILLEKYLAYRLGISEFPQNAIFMVDGEEREYLVCGTIRNYSGNLVTSNRDLNLRKDYPSAITPGYRENAEVSLLILQKRLNLGTSTEDMYDVMDLRNEYGISPYFSALNKYMDETYQNTIDFERFGLVYMMAVLLVLLLVEAVIFRAVVLKNKCSERSLRELGLTKKEVMLAYGLRFGKVFLETIGFQVVIGVLWAKIGGYLTGYGKLLEKHVWYTLLKEFAVLVLLLLILAVMAWDRKTWEKTADVKQKKNSRYLFRKLNEMQEAYGLSVFDIGGGERWEEWEDILEGEEARRYEPLPWDTFEVLILPEQQYQLFLNENGIPWEDSPSAMPECIMVLPMFAEDEEIVGVSDGSAITVGRVFLQDGKLLFEKEEYCAWKVLKNAKGMEESFSARCLCGLVFSAAQAEKSKLISGYSHLYFRLRGDATKQQQEEIDNAIAMLAASAQGGGSFSTIEEQKDDALFESYAAFMGTTMFVFALFAMGAFVFMHYYVSWEKNKYVYGVFRSMGMPYRTLCGKLFVQYVTGIVFAWFFACYIVENVFGYRFTAGQVALCTGFLLLFIESCYAVLYGVYKKTAICKMLQEE